MKTQSSFLGSFRYYFSFALNKTASHFGSKEQVGWMDGWIVEWNLEYISDYKQPVDTLMLVIWKSLVWWKNQVSPRLSIERALVGTVHLKH